MLSLSKLVFRNFLISFHEVSGDPVECKLEANQGKITIYSNWY